MERERSSVLIETFTISKPLSKAGSPCVFAFQCVHFFALFSHQGRWSAEEPPPPPPPPQAKDLFLGPDTRDGGEAGGPLSKKCQVLSQVWLSWLGVIGHHPQTESLLV